jgi:type I restriction enzyme S subunit
MIGNLKPYPAMKESGVPWLGQVPEHWNVRRLKYVLRERDIRSAKGVEQLLRVSQFTGVTERKRLDGGDEPDTRAESLVGYKLVEPSDLVVNIMLAWNGSMGVSSFAGIASPAYCVYRFGAHAQPWYFHHLLRSPAYKARIKAVSTGVVESRLRLYTDDLYRLEALLLPLPEQAAIVRFLDHYDRKIRRYIRAKQKLIKLLEEEKQAIIHHAVTHGLNPNVPLKPSGVEWLGDIPMHWETLPLRRRWTITDCKHLTVPFVEEGIPLASVREVQSLDLALAKAKRTTLEWYDTLVAGNRMPKKGDLIYCRNVSVGAAA